MGVAAIAVALVLAAHGALARRPLAGLRGFAGVAALALALLAGWTLLSGTWGDATGRAVVEADRAVLYLLAVAALGALALRPGGLRLAVAGVAAAAVVVCGIGLVTRVAADVWPIGDGVGKSRLAYPITYWNSFGLLAVFGALLCLHLTSDEGTPRIGRVAAAAATPGLIAALVLSYSRGAAAAGIVGLVAYLLLGRPRLLMLGLVATVPAAVAAGVAAYDAERLATTGYDSPAGVAQGHDVALVVGLAMLAAALLRALLLRLDLRLSIRPPLARRTRTALVLAAAAVLLGAAGGAVAAGAPGALADSYEEFVEGKPLSSSDPNIRARLTDPSNNGRIEYWEVSLDAFHEDPLKGSGAGTFRYLWAHDRSIQVAVIDAHTLYGEVLGELGLVGIVLLALALLALLVGVARRMSGGEERALHAAVLAVLLTWMLAAAVDWHWEIPAVTLPVLALAAAAAGSRTRAEEPAAERPPRSLVARVAVPVAAVALAITPAAAALSQSRLNRAVRDLKAGDCRSAVDEADSSLSAMGFREEPYEVIGYCRSRQDRGPEAVQALERAIDRDPRNWELWYGLALVRGGAGLDPRHAAARALRLNPKEERVRGVVARFRPHDRAGWRRVARAADLPIP